MDVLQNVNASLKKEVQALRRENASLHSELEKYKLLAERGRFQRGSDAVPNPLLRQMLAMKEDLDQTRHRLLQYEIFDENSEVDILGLLNAAECPTTAVHEKKPRELTGTEMVPLIERQSVTNSEWLRIEKLIKLGNVQSIEQLLDSDAVSMFAGDAVGVHSVLEAAVRNNQREMVQKIMASAIGIKMGNRLLCHRYDDGQTVLMMAATNGSLQIASDLLDFYSFNAIHSGDGAADIYPFLNIRDSRGRTLLMRVCRTDRAPLVHWVLTRYLNHKVELKTLIEATDNSGKDIFGGYVRSKAVESVIHEYAPLIDSDSAL